MKLACALFERRLSLWSRHGRGTRWHLPEEGGVAAWADEAALRSLSAAVDLIAVVMLGILGGALVPHRRRECGLDQVAMRHFASGDALARCLLMLVRAPQILFKRT